MVAKKKPAKPADDEVSPTTTLQVDREIADRVRALSKTLGVTAMVLTNELLKAAIETGKVSVPQVTVTFGKK